MIKQNKAVFSVLFIIFISLMFMTASLLIVKKLGDKTASKEEKEANAISIVCPGYTSYEELYADIDGIERIYKVRLGEDKTVYAVTASYKGFSQNVRLAACFEGAELTYVKKLASSGIPSYYDERVTDDSYLENFCGALSTDPDLTNADRAFIEIDTLSQYDAASAAALDCVDRCCKAYFENVYQKGGANG